MQTWMWIVIGVAVGLAVAGIVAAVVVSARRERARRELRRDFGPEYERAVADAPTRRDAEADLLERKQRRDLLDIRPLTPDAAAGYEREWHEVQTRFVDDPGTAVADADRLVQQVMVDRGYPMSDFDARADLISVDHPAVVENYRAAHRISLAHTQGVADTEELRAAFVHYRALFADLLETEDDRLTTSGARTEEVR